MRERRLRRFALVSAVGLLFGGVLTACATGCAQKQADPAAGSPGYYTGPMSKKGTLGKG